MKKILFIGLTLLSTISLYANWRMDRVALKCQDPDGFGNMSLQAITVSICGTIQSKERAFPDLVVERDKWYPGVSLYKYVCHDDDGVPVFENAGDIAYSDEISIAGSTNTLVQDGNAVKLFFYTKDTLNVAQFVPERMSFEMIASVPFPQMRFKPKAMYVEKMGQYGYRVWYGAQDRWAEKVPGHYRKKNYYAYDGAGIWRGAFSYMGLYCVDIDENYKAVNSPEIVSQTSNEVLQSYCKISNLQLDKINHGIVGGSYFGGLYYYKQKGKGISLEDKKYLVDEKGVALRNPGIAASPISYPSKDGIYSDLIVCCEGGVYYYRYSGKLNTHGNPVYEKPMPLQEKAPLLYGGSLPVPTVVDWDGDGILDIISGNSQGFIQFFKNCGSNENPSFISPINLKAGGIEIHVQAGYKEDIQGPLEARWGYTCPNVFDWDEDGRLDIIIGDARGKQMIFLGKDGPVEDRLEPEHPLYCYDLEMHGTWRCRPGIVKAGNTLLYATLDDDNELHLYSKIDCYNLRDLGKMIVKGGRTIPASIAHAGGTGRLKIEFADWDGDGKIDILLGTCKHHSIMGQEGIPELFHKADFANLMDEKDIGTKYSIKDVTLYGPVYKGSSPDVNAASMILFMKNVGKNEKPIYLPPEIIRFEGEKIKLGQHSAGVSVAMLGKIEKGLPNLLVSDERGRFYLLDRKTLTW